MKDQSKFAAIHYVDDDEDDLMIFELATENVHAKVFLYNRGENLLNGLAPLEPKPAIVFADLNMPTMSGYEVIARIKGTANLNGVPVVILSTAGDRPTVAKCKELGADYFIQKPTSTAKLQSAIEFVISIDWSNFSPSIDKFIHSY